MKKVFYLFTLVIGLMVFLGCTSSEMNSINTNSEITYDYDSVQDEIIRFHVIANSDSDKDQQLKLKVRDEVIKFLSPLLDQSSSIEESRKILKENDEEVKKIAKKVIEENGYKYSVESELSRENFPEKIYGNIVLPQGEYEAYRILIGKSSGQNWWCVMFPPLCFIDVTKGEVAYNETERQMNEVVNNKNKQDDNEEDNKQDNDKVLENNIDEKINQTIVDNESVKEIDIDIEDDKDNITIDKNSIKVDKDDKENITVDKDEISNDISGMDLEVNDLENDDKKIEDDTTIQEDNYNVKLKSVELIKGLFK